jgi:hypothetical protein
MANAQAQLLPEQAQPAEGTKPRSGLAVNCSASLDVFNDWCPFCLPPMPALFRRLVPIFDWPWSRDMSLNSRHGAGIEGREFSRSVR